MGGSFWQKRRRMEINERSTYSITMHCNQEEENSTSVYLSVLLLSSAFCSLYAVFRSYSIASFLFHSHAPTDDCENYTVKLKKVWILFSFIFRKKRFENRPKKEKQKSEENSARENIIPFRYFEFKMNREAAWWFVKNNNWVMCTMYVLHCIYWELKKFRNSRTEWVCVGDDVDRPIFSRINFRIM